METAIKKAILGLEQIRSERYGEQIYSPIHHLLIQDVCNTAIGALWEKNKRDNPQPLTLSGLKQREGEPVWIKFSNSIVCCILLKVDEENIIHILATVHGETKLIFEEGAYYANKPKEG